MVLVRFRKHGLEYIADVIPKALVEGRPASIYDGELPQTYPRAIWLTTNARADVARCLLDMGLEPASYIQEATVHKSWKLQRHQGVIYARRVYVEVDEDE
ncbi:MAG: hypothetical protein QXW98_04495 [Candidatus Caldarchaeum sp.]